MPFVDEMPERRLENPDTGEWFDVRELSWKELEECRRERERKEMGRLREIPAAIFEAVDHAERDGSEADAIERAREENARAEALEAFDREALVMKSVVGWSFETHFQPSRLVKLDERTFTWLFAEIASLYVEDDAQRKAVSANSTST